MQNKKNVKSLHASFVALKLVHASIKKTHPTSYIYNNYRNLSRVLVITEGVSTTVIRRKLNGWLHLVKNDASGILLQYPSG